MGLFDNIFGKKERKDNIATNGYFKTLNAYTPVFQTYSGKLYETELIRSVVHSFATQCAKLKPEIKGSVYKGLEKKLQFKPNDFMDSYKMIYRLATILEIENTAFIIPILGKDGETIEGIYPILPSRVEIIQYDNIPYLRYTFQSGESAVIELDRVGIMTKFQYKDDFFGETNKALNPTMQLLDTQRQGIIEGIKNGARIRYMAKLTGNLRADDIEAEKKRFSKYNLSSENDSGMLLYDSKYDNVEQVKNQNFIIDAEQTRLIQENVYNYFGINQKILQNSYSEDDWNAYYESKVEPFALQLSLVLTNMFFTEKDKESGSEIFFSANRLQFASNATKLEISSTLLDRGVLTTNQVLEIWNLPPVKDGNKRYIRKEYAEMDNVEGVDKFGKQEESNKPTEEGI